MTESTDLLPCPFCGGDAEIVDAVEAGESAKVVCCKRCLSSSKVVFALMDDVTFDLASAWNTRARPMTVAEAAKLLLDNTPNPTFDILKYPMIGEFKQSIAMQDEDGEEVWRDVTIEWTTIKEIFAAGLRALSQGGE